MSKHFIQLTCPGTFSLVGRVSVPGNRSSWVRSRVTTYQSKALLKSGQVIQSVCAWNQKPSCSTALRGQYEVHVVNSMKGRSLFFLENYKSLNYFSRMLEIYVSRKTYMRSKHLNQVNILVRIQSSRSWIISLAHETSLYIA